MNRRIELLRKDLIEKINEILKERCPNWRMAEFENRAISREVFDGVPDVIMLETLCDFLDALDGIIPLLLMD